MADEFKVLIGATLKSEDIENIRSQIRDTKIEPIKLSIDTSNIQQQLKSISDQIKKTIGDVKVGVGNSGKSIPKINTFNIDAKFNNKTFANEIDNISKKMSFLNNASKETSDSVKQLNAAFNAMDEAKEAGDIELLTKRYNEYTDALKKAQNQIKIDDRRHSESKRSEKFELNKSSFSYDFEKWAKNSSAATNAFGDRIEELRNKIRTCDATNLDNLKKEFKDLQRDVVLADKNTMSFGDKLKKKLSDYGVYLSTAMITTEAVRVARQMINDVIELDTALIDLQKTTDASYSKLNEYYYKANDIAKQYGSTTKDIIQSTADWSRLGFTLDESEIMAQYSSMFRSISNGMDMDTATSGLVSIMKAFDIDAEDALDGIISKINAVGNTAATSNEDIVEGLQNSSSAMAMMGATLDETIALFTAGQEIAQDSSKVGNALRTIAMRIRGYSEDTGELSDELSDISGQVIDLTKVASNDFKGISLFTDDSQTEYKGIYQYLQEISQIYDELGAKERQNLMEKLFGKNRASVGMAILSNFSAAEKAMGTMAGSFGSAEKEMETITESLTYKLNALKETVVGIGQNLFARGDMASVIDGLTRVLEVIDKITGKIGLFGTIAAGFAIGKLISPLMLFSKEIKKGASIIDVFAAAFPHAAKGIGIFNEGLAKAAGGVDVLKAALSGVGTVIKAHPIIAVIGGIIAAVKIFDALTVSAKEAKEEMAKAFDSYNESKQKVADINNELEKTQKAYNDLLAKDSLTFAEQSELERLAKVTEQLEIQKDLAEKAEKANASAAASSAVTAYEKEYKNDINEEETKYYENLDYDTYGENKYDAIASYNADENVSAQIAALRTLRKEIDITRKSYEEVYKVDLSSNTPEDLLKMYQDEEMIESNIWEQAKKLEEYYSQLSSVPMEELLKIPNGVETLNEISAAIEYIYSELDPAKWKQMQLDKILNLPVVSKAKSELVELAKASNNVGVTAEQIAKDYPKLIEALDGTGFTVEDLVNQINSEAGIINYDERRKQLVDSYTKDLEDSLSGAEVNPEVDVNPEIITSSEKMKQWFSDWVSQLSDEDVDVVLSLQTAYDTSGWDSNKWTEMLEFAKSEAETASEDIRSSFSKLLTDTSGEDTGFSKQIDSYIKKTGELQDALKKVRSGDLSDIDKVKLFEEFPSIADNADDLDDAIISLLGDMDDDMIAEFEKQFGNMKDPTEEDIKAFNNYKDAVLELGKVVDSANLSVDIEAETEGATNFVNALKESASATGLNAESIKNLKERYGELSEYGEYASVLFERTSNGIHLNTKAVRELESAYKRQKTEKLAKEIATLQKRYKDLSEQIDNATDEAERSELYAQREDILNQLNEVADLAAQYRGLTSAYKAWEEAQSTPNENDMFKSISGDLEKYKEMYEKGLDINTDDFRSFVQLMTDADVSQMDPSQVLAVFEKGMPIMERFFTNSTEGLQNFLDDGLKLSQEAGKDWFSFDEKTGLWNLDFSNGGDEEVAKAFGMSTEQLQIMLHALNAAGFEIDFGSTIKSLDDLNTNVEDTESKLKEMGQEPVDINVNAEDLDSEITKAKEKLDEIQNSDLKPEVKAAMIDDLLAKLDVLIAKKIEAEQPSFMSIDTSSVNASLVGITTALQEYQTAVNTLNTLKMTPNVDPSLVQAAQQRVDELAGEIQSFDSDTKVKVNLEADGSIESIKEQIANNEVKIPIGADTTQASSAVDGLSDKTIDVTANVVGEDAIDSLQAKIDSLHGKTVYTTNISRTARIGGTNSGQTTIPMVDGTAYAKGTAFKRGDWGTKDSGVALVGELGRKILRLHIEICV